MSLLCLRQETVKVLECSPEKSHPERHPIQDAGYPFYYYYYYYYYYSAFGPLRPPFTPAPLFSSFLLIVLVPLIQYHFQLLLSSLTGRREIRDPGKDLSLVRVLFCPSSFLLAH